MEKFNEIPESKPACISLPSNIPGKGMIKRIATDFDSSKKNSSGKKAYCKLILQMYLFCIRLCPWQCCHISYRLVIVILVLQIFAFRTA